MKLVQKTRSKISRARNVLLGASLGGFLAFQSAMAQLFQWDGTTDTLTTDATAVADDIITEVAGVITAVLPLLVISVIATYVYKWVKRR